MRYSYFKSGDSLGVASAETGQLLWLDLPEGYAVRAVAAIPDTDDRLVLLESDTGKASRQNHFENLWRYSHEKGVIWRAELPQSGANYYVAFELQTGGLWANSWSCFRVAIDLETGTIRSKTFTK